MTAEVVILNKTAAAMAADSKGTIRVGGIVKTHDTLNKLFTLSKYHPVGTMIYGNAEMMGTPWETIIKIYRDKLRDHAFHKLNNYAHDFIVGLHTDYRPSSKRQASGVYWIARDFFERVLDRSHDIEYETRRSGNPVGLEEAIEASYRVWSHAVERSTILRSFRDTDADVLEGLYVEPITDAFRDTFENKSKNAVESKFVKTACEALRRAQFSESVSGLVFAGFGDKEIFPSMKAYMIDGVVAGKLRATILDKSCVSNTITATIRPFAQNDMVIRFMEGIDPDYRTYIQGAIYTLADDLVSTVIDSYAKGSKKTKEGIKIDLRKFVNELVEDMTKEARNYRREFFVEPITDMAAMLPKEDLAHLAESLVNLTSLKRRMSLDEESVGGPIDVAVISKGDGFIWIKRKHYFASDLNKSFMMNYFRQHLKANGETGYDRYTRHIKGS